MAAHTGLNSVEDGLVFYYDMDNAKKSFKGKPTTNLVTEPTVAFSNWSGLTGSTVAYLNKEGRQGVRLQTLTSGGVQWYNTGGQQEILPNTQYTVSATIKYSGAIPHPNLFYIRQYTSAGSQTSERGQYTSSLQVPLGGGWYRAYRTFTSDSSATRMLVQGYQYAGGIIIDIEDVQLEQGSFATPFVEGTRPSANSLLDLTGNYDITPQNLTYNSDGSFEFDGVDDFITVSDFSYPNDWNDPFSLEAWIYIPTGADWHNQDNGTTSNSGTVIVGRGSYAGSHGLARVDTRQFRFIIRTNDGLYSRTFTNASYDTWYHLVGTYNGTTSSLYVNGILHQAGVVSGKSGVPDGGTWRIGGNLAFGGNNGRYGEGKIPEAKIYNKPLTAAEVKQNFEASRNKYGV